MTPQEQAQATLEAAAQAQAQELEGIAQAQEQEAVAQAQDNQPPLTQEGITQAFMSAIMNAKELYDKQQAQQAEPQKTTLQAEDGESVVLNEIKKRLGLDALESENQALRQYIESFKLEQERAKVASEVASFKGEYGEAAEQKVVDYLNSLDEKTASGLNTPTGWRLIAQSLGLSKQGATPKSPDPITASNAPTTISGDDMYKRLQEGKLSGVEQGNMLLKLAGM